MIGIPAPERLTQQISRRAVEIAQIIGPRKTGKGLNSLIPLYQPGIIGIEVPQETAYMMDLEKGIKAHAMMDLAGRVIPIRNTNGTIAFRRVGADKIGVIPIITRLAKDGRLRTGRPEWVYPNKSPMSFLQKSLQISVNEWKRTAKTKDIIDLLMQSEVKDEISQIVYGRDAIQCLQQNQSYVNVAAEQRLRTSISKAIIQKVRRNPHLHMRLV